MLTKVRLFWIATALFFFIGCVSKRENSSSYQHIERSIPDLTKSYLESGNKVFRPGLDSILQGDSSKIVGKDSSCNKMELQGIPDEITDNGRNLPSRR